MKKMLRRALLGGAAVAMMAAGAQAGELEALKAQLEALQTRVATMESRAAQVPAGASLITMERGLKAGISNELFDDNALDLVPASRGTTIAITPTADLPAPVASIELSGQIRAVVLWQSEEVAPATGYGAGLDDFDITARGQVNLSATVDTAIGRVTGGMQFRGDMTGAANTPALTIRTAWATWQMTDALSLTFGNTGQIATLSNVGNPTIATHYGLDNTRRPQVRLTYASGPFNLRFGIEDPRADNNAGAPGATVVPAIAASMGLNMGMFGLRVGGEIDKVDVGAQNKTGYIMNAGINMGLGSMGSVAFGGAYTKGLACDGLMASGGIDAGALGGALSCNNLTDLVKAVALKGVMTLNMTETTTFNVVGGYFKAKNDPVLRKGWSVGGNIVYRPVDALQFAVEADYAVRKSNAGVKDKDLVIGTAAWFFF